MAAGPAGSTPRPGRSPGPGAELVAEKILWRGAKKKTDPRPQKAKKALPRCFFVSHALGAKKSSLNPGIFSPCSGGD